MSYIPAIPQVAQENYGQGYGNWQQYAGYSGTHPYGGGQGQGVQPKSISAVTPPNTQAPATSFTGALQQQAQNVTKSINKKINNVTTAYDQASQGNAYNAVQALNGKYQTPNQQSTGINPETIGSTTGMESVN